VAPELRFYIKSPHAQSTRHYGFDCQTADAGEHTGYARSQQCFTLPIEAHRVRFPIGRKPF